MGGRPALLLALLLATGCATGGARYTPIPDWVRPLCHPGVVAVQTQHDRLIRDVLQRFLQTPEIEDAVRGWSLRAVAVEGLPHLGIVCYAPPWATILLSTTALEQAQARSPADVERIVVWLTAHELAHVALRHYLIQGTDRQVVMETEADELSTYFLARAGYECRDLVAATWYRLGVAEPNRPALATACEGAKRGQRPARRLSFDW